MGVRRPEAPSEGGQLIEVERLIAKEQDQVSHKGIVEDLNVVVAQRARQVDAVHFGAECRGHGFDTQFSGRHVPTPS
jgi:hypothetical protein